jgi:uncharacterized protein (DUF1501 family)
MTISRRALLKGVGAGAFAGQLSMLPRYALASPSGYKALVCIFLYGGNDGNNTVIPLDSTNYSYYQGWRGSLALTASNGGAPLPLANTKFGLHPAMSGMRGLWGQGKVSIVLNVGTLIGPNLTVAGYQSDPYGADVPLNLFSHQDQKNEWKSAVYKDSGISGWGGRIADTLPKSGNGVIPPMISFAGPDLFTLGNTSQPLSLPGTGAFGLNPFPGSTSQLINNAFNTLYDPSQTAYGNIAVQAVQSLTQAGVAASALINPILKANNSSIDSYFGGLSSDLAKQLWAVAKIIASQATLSAQTQIFMVSHGNFDTHQDQLNAQNTLLQQLDEAVTAFYNASVTLGLDQNVTTFTMSDFSRTYVPNTNGGTDHAWGNHHFVIGGSVRGQIFGTYPPLNDPANNSGKAVGPLDISTEGRWLPGYSVDQYAATLAAWLGVGRGHLQNIFPTLKNFGAANLGFMKN